MIGDMRNIRVAKRLNGNNPASLVITPMRNSCHSRLGADKQTKPLQFSCPYLVPWHINMHNLICRFG